MEDNKIAEQEGPQDRPIVKRPERPDWLWEDEHPFPPASTKDNRQQQLRDWIEFIESELELCKASKGPFKKIDMKSQEKPEGPDERPIVEQLSEPWLRGCTVWDTCERFQKDDCTADCDELDY